MNFLNKPWLFSYPEQVPYEITPPAVSIDDLLKDSSNLHPEKTAVIDNQKVKTYYQLNSDVDRLASALYDSGFKKGDKLAIMLPNCLEYIISFFAVQRLCGTVVQVNPLYTPRELEYILEDSEAVWFITNRIQVPKLEQIGYKDKLTVLIAEGEKDVKDSLNAWIEKGTNPSPEVNIDIENDIAILQYTGGTTGRAKGVMISHYNLISNLYQNKESSVGEASEGSWERIIGIAPMFHAMGLTTMVTTIFRGGTFNTISRFELNLLVETIRNFKPTTFSGSPTMYIALLNHPHLTSEDLKSIKICSSGSAPLSVEIMNRFEEKTGAPIIEAYGLSEATTMVTKNPSEGVRKPGSIGIPIPSTDCRIVDIATGTIELPVGETGELIVKGPQVMKGYWKNEEETANALRDGWLFTGDLAVMDEDGYFYIVGRKKDMIIAGGFNIYPLEIEEVLYQLPAVREVCVYGVPDPYRGETVKAAIVLKENVTLTEKEVEEWCNQNLARYKVPRLIEFKDELPKTAVGKILRTKLIEQEKERAASTEKTL
ncbi:long-chain fatty acid--CoA ligase [Bacillus sp. FJAT-29953]|nr:long-chain fatty acid--CoA ligase [Bacillus sp. FJAT-29953]